MNILLTSVGRRAYMVKYFKKALEENGKIFVSNSDDRSIAFKYADESIISPLIYSDEYIAFLLEFCRKKSIDIVISLFDIDLLMLARHKEQFEEIDTKVIVSDPKIVEICNDKWKTYIFLKDNGFHTPISFLHIEDVMKAISSGKLSYPIVVKPRYGCGSISVAIAYDEEDIRYLTKKVNEDINKTYLKYESALSKDKVIYQAYLEGQEYGADIINDLNGEIQNIIIRKKLAMRSGETDIAEIVDEPVIKNELNKLGKITKHIANMDCDIFLINDIPYILEMNARFGGGYPFSHMSGCNLPKAIIEWSEGKPVDKSTLTSRIGGIWFKEITIVEM
ncbi:ATP-grasp domain-containing protein [uncultured Dubosiella sp.]|uniref:ATP-grasp domain-containing protein n=1 Tax=uncultured Dubosiella sp. TaxID=1937011 RepID=UPI00262DEE98|nr:ATP-grasp domain-containing protein [uncultured Dubosiella sp.]